MNRRVLNAAAISVSVLVYGWGCTGASIAAGGQGKKDPTVVLPKFRHASESADIDRRSIVVSMPAEGEFYVSGQRLRARRRLLQLSATASGTSGLTTRRSSFGAPRLFRSARCDNC